MCFICVSGRGCGTPHFLCVGDGLGTADLLRSIRRSKAVSPHVPRPSTSPKESRDSLIPRVERQYNRSSSPGAQKCSQREALRLRL